ncbi:alpha/beta fold hydrolase [Nocardiopsis trehalosi]|uniref:alpha/beta fold hydrolase n=1 Tax=Nocardiopsis trehalosi TaxID=109329 RepID=UPI00082AFAE1|nr:alpha/beta hydrolase [Nocardiopsis trehalosi]
MDSDIAPTLVLVPCFSGAAWDTAPLTPLAHRPMRAPRLPDGLTDVEGYADAIADTVADLDSYVLVGDSFGAVVALALAVRRPDGLRGLVLSGGFAADPLPSPLHRAAMRLMGRARGPLYRSLVLRAHAARLASPYDTDGEVPWSTARSRRLFLDNTPATSFGARVTAALSADYTAHLGRVDVPTLVLTPAHDVLIGAGAARVLLDGIPDARETVLPRTGHMFRFTHPSAYARAVDEFTAQHVDRRRVADARG